MPRVGRLAGAILVEAAERFWLVGNTKVPCDWAKAGFEPPVEIDALRQPFVELRRAGDVVMAAPWLELPGEAEAVAALMAERFLIARNGSVSDRLWRLVVAEAPGGIEARWLCEMPTEVWAAVRDAVLRCS